jgi:hypothetical protein
LGFPVQSFQYGDGTKVQCSVIQEAVELGSFAFVSAVCEATSITTTTAQTDGIIGFRPVQSETDPADLAEVLASLNTTMLSMWYSKNQKLQNNGDGGEVTFGDLNTERYIGQISWQFTI